MMTTSDILTYLISVSIATAALYGLYAILLKNQTHFKLNRICILGILMVSLVIPFMEMTKKPEVDPLPPSKMATYKFIPNIAAPIYQQFRDLEHFDYLPNSSTFSPPAITLGDTLFIVYCIVSLLLLYRFLARLYSMCSMIRQSRDTDIKGSKALIHPNLPVSSFLGYVFWKKEVHPLDHLILAHEQAHLRQYHTLDIILIDLLSTVFWFNPIHYFMKSELQLIHEYLADEAVLNQHQDKRQYASLLCNQHNTSELHFLQTFQSHVPNRLKMIRRKRSHKRSYFNYILFVPIVAGLVTLLSRAEAQNILSSAGQSVDQIQAQNILSLNRPGASSPLSTTNLEWGKHLIPMHASTRAHLSLKTSMRLPLMELMALSSELIYLHDEGQKNALTIHSAFRIDPSDQRRPLRFGPSKSNHKLTISEIIAGAGPIADHSLFRISLRSNMTFVTLDLTVLNASENKNYISFENKKYFQTLFNDSPSYPNLIDRANHVTTQQLVRLLKAKDISTTTEGVNGRLETFDIYSLENLHRALNQNMLISDLDHGRVLDRNKLISDLQSGKPLRNPIALMHHNTIGVPYLAIFTTELPVALQYEEYQELNGYESNDLSLLLKVNQEISFGWGSSTFESVPRNQLFQFSSYAPPIYDITIRAQNNMTELDQIKEMLLGTPRLHINDKVVNKFQVAFAFIDHLGVPSTCQLFFQDGKCLAGEEDLNKVIQTIKVNDFIQNLSIGTGNKPLLLQESIKVATKEEIQKSIDSNSPSLPAAALNIKSSSTH